MIKHHYRIYLYNKKENDFCKEMAMIAANTNTDENPLAIEKLYSIAESVRANNKFDNVIIHFDGVLNTLTFEIKNEYGGIGSSALILIYVQLIEIANPVNESV